MRPVQGYHSVLSANSHTADKQLPNRCYDSVLTAKAHMRDITWGALLIGGHPILVVSEQLQHHSCTCTYNVVRMPPGKRQQVQ
jgi:hypothetical protein